MKLTNIACGGVLKSHGQELKLHANFTPGVGKGGPNLKKISKN